MKAAILDPTAGVRARSIREIPWARRQIVDPTDPCYGTLSPDVREDVARVGRIVDPTDAEYGYPSERPEGR
jgi:hypothetical protein